MNAIQRIILSIGLFFLFLSCIVVPWSIGSIITPPLMHVGYFPIWWDAFVIATNADMGAIPHIDPLRLTIQLLAISFLTAFGVVLAGIKKKS